jgi:hypothetical protein
MEAIRRKKDSFFSGFSYLLGILFFVTYSIIILRDYAILSGICLFSTLVFIMLASSLTAYTGEESFIITDVKDAKRLIEWKGDELSDRKVNDLVSLFRSRKKEMGWKGVVEILRDYDYWGDDLWQDAASIRERKRLWEK